MLVDIDGQAGDGDGTYDIILDVYGNVAPMPTEYTVDDANLALNEGGYMTPGNEFQDGVAVNENATGMEDNMIDPSEMV